MTGKIYEDKASEVWLYTNADGQSRLELRHTWKRLIRCEGEFLEQPLRSSQGGVRETTS